MPGVIPELDAVLDPLRSGVFKDKEEAFRKYRNHCQRMANFSLLNLATMTTVTDRHRRLVAVAAAFHDLGIWSHNDWDYLAPSEEDAREYMRGRGSQFSEDDAALVVQMIEEHHKFWPVKYEGVPNREAMALVESFRRGDWTDVSFGLFLWAATREEFNQLRRDIPVDGFFELLAATCFDYWRRHPFSNPMPMMKW